MAPSEFSLSQTLLFVPKKINQYMALNVTYVHSIIPGMKVAFPCIERVMKFLFLIFFFLRRILFLNDLISFKNLPACLLPLGEK